MYELLSGVAIMVCSQILGVLPTQQWINDIHKQQICFALGVAVTLMKGMEFFFSKTVAMFKSHEVPDSLEVTTTATSVITTSPASAEETKKP